MTFLRFGNFVTSTVSFFQKIHVAVDGQQGVVVWFCTHVQPNLPQGAHEVSLRKDLEEKFDFGVCTVKAMANPPSMRSNMYNAYILEPVPKDRVEALTKLSEDDK